MKPEHWQPTQRKRFDKELRRQHGLPGFSLDRYPELREWWRERWARRHFKPALAWRQSKVEPGVYFSTPMVNWPAWEKSHNQRVMIVADSRKPGRVDYSLSVENQATGEQLRIDASALPPGVFEVTEALTFDLHEAAMQINELKVRVLEHERQIGKINKYGPRRFKRKRRTRQRPEPRQTDPGGKGTKND